MERESCSRVKNGVLEGKSSSAWDASQNKVRIKWKVKLLIGSA